MVEHMTENHGVSSSILLLGTWDCGRSDGAAKHLVTKERVASSNLVFGSAGQGDVAKW